jgi:recombination protein RecT
MPVNKRMEQFRDLIYRYRDKLAAVLPRGVTVERISQLGLVAMAKDSKVLACTPVSVLRALTIAGQLGLDPTGVGGEAWVVAYKNQAQLLVGYKGMLQLARRSGAVVGIECHVVHSNDTFEIEYGSHPRISHRPVTSGEPGQVLGAYAIVRLKDDTYPMLEYMTKAEIDLIRARSRAGAEGPWRTDYEAMARKTCLRRILNYAPAARELQQAMAVEDRQEQGDGNSDTSDILPFPSLEEDTPNGTPISKADEIAQRLHQNPDKPDDWGTGTTMKNPDDEPPL